MHSCWNFCSRLRLNRQQSSPLVSGKMQGNGLRVRQYVRKPAQSDVSNHPTGRRPNHLSFQEAKEVNQLKESPAALQSMHSSRRLPFNCSLSRVDPDETDKALFSKGSGKWLLQASPQRTHGSPFVIKHHGSRPKLVPITPLRRKQALAPSI